MSLFSVHPVNDEKDDDNDEDDYSREDGREDFDDDFRSSDTTLMMMTQPQIWRLLYWR